MPRFLARSPYRTLDVGAYVQIQPEPHRLGDPAPEIPAGTEIAINGVPAVVRQATRTEIIIEIGGTVLLLTPLKPTEMRNVREAWEPGMGSTEWVVREKGGVGRPHQPGCVAQAARVSD